VSVDNNSNREYAALGASQQQVSSEIAALRDKVDEAAGSQVQFGPVIHHTKPLLSTFNCDQYVAEPVVLGKGYLCVKQDVESEVNKQIVDVIDEMVSIVLMESNIIEIEGNSRKETKLALVPEWQPAAFSVAHESCVQCPVSSSFVNSSDEGVDNPESVVLNNCLTVSGALLELCSQDIDNSAKTNDCGSLCEAVGKSKAQFGGNGSFSSVNRPTYRASDSWPNVSYPEGCTTAKQNQSALRASPAAGFQADGGSV
jgi:hypothetical protein